MIQIKSPKFFSSGVVGLALLLAFSSSALAYGTDTYSNDTTGAPVCNSAVPNKPWLYKAVAAGNGEVDLFWDRVDGATSWTVAYGVRPGVYIYGATNIGNNSSRGLRITRLPSQKYYFVVRANNNCMPGPFSNEWSLSVGGRGPLVATNLTRVVQSPVGSGLPAPTLTPVPTARPTNLPTATFAPRPATTPVVTPAPKPLGFFDRIGQFLGGLFK